MESSIYVTVWTWNSFIHGLNLIELGWLTVTPFVISNHCSTVDAVSHKLCFMDV